MIPPLDITSINYDSETKKKPKPNTLRRLLSFKSEKSSENLESKRSSRRLSKSFRLSTHLDIIPGSKPNYNELSIEKIHEYILKENIFNSLEDSIKVAWGIYLFDFFPEENAIAHFSTYFYQEKEIKNLIEVFQVLKKEARKAIIVHIPTPNTIHLVAYCNTKEIKLILSKCPDIESVYLIYNLLTYKQKEDLNSYFHVKLEKVRYFNYLKHKYPLILVLMIKNLYLNDVQKMHEIICIKKLLTPKNHKINEIIVSFLLPHHWANILPDLSLDLLFYLRKFNLIAPLTEIRSYSEMNQFQFEKMIQEKKLPTWMDPVTIFLIEKDKINRNILINDVCKYYEIAENTNEKIIQLEAKISEFENSLIEMKQQNLQIITLLENFRK